MSFIIIFKLMIIVQSASFQIVLALSYSSQKTYVIFNYEKVDWISASKNVFIGYSNGKGNAYTNPFSNNGDSNTDPSLIVKFKGNAGKF